MSYTLFHEFKNSIIHLLQDYCKNYIFFKPRHYLLANKYLEKIYQLNYSENDKMLIILTMTFKLYKRLIERKSEMLATNIGLSMASHFQVNEVDFLRYRESKIWTQRYIQGISLFECRVYAQGNSKLFANETDPLYISYVKWKNKIELSKVIIDQTEENNMNLAS